MLEVRGAYVSDHEVYHAEEASSSTMYEGGGSVMPLKVSSVEFLVALDRFMSTEMPCPINPNCVDVLAACTNGDAAQASGIDLGLTLGLMIADKRKGYH